MQRKRYNPVVSMNIRAEMKRRGLTRKDMAKGLEMSVDNFDKILQAPESRLSIGRLRVIAVMLKTTPTELMEEK